MHIVVCMRPSDSGNEYEVFGAEDTLIIDVDYGYMDLHDPVEFHEWKTGHMTEVFGLRAMRNPDADDAARFLEDLVAQAEVDYGHKPAVGSKRKGGE